MDRGLGAGGQGVLLRSDDFVEDLVGDGRLVGAEAVEGGLVFGDRALVQGEQPAQQWFVGCWLQAVDADSGQPDSRASGWPCVVVPWAPPSRVLGASLACVCNAGVTGM